MRRPHASLASAKRLLRVIPYAELSVALAATVGFALVTWFFASLLTPMVWALGGGVYLMSLAGFGLLWRVAIDGLYVLSREDGDD